MNRLVRMEKRMFKFSLDDLTLVGLQKIAGYYGIPTANIPRNDLANLISQRMSAGAEVSFGPGSRLWWKNPSVVVAILAVLVTAGTMSAHWYSIHRTIGKDVEQREKEKKLLWQRVIVYTIIEKDGNKNPSGISFDDIRGRYIQEVVAAKKEDQLQGELDEFTLRGILIDLSSLQQIYRIVGDKYISQKAFILHGADRLLLQDQAMTIVLNMLAVEPEQYTADQLAQKAVDAAGITRQEFNRILTELIALNAVAFNDKNQLYNRAFPKKKEDNKKDKK